MHETENPNPADRMAGKSGQPNLGGDPTAAFSFSRAPRASERRRHARQDVLNQQLVPITLGADNGGLLLDLSTGGAAVQAVAPLQSTGASPFAFRLPQLNSQIEGTGVFVWVGDTGLAGGLRFDQLSPQAQQLLEQWLKGSQTETAPAPPDTAREPVAGPVEAGIPETTVAPAPAPTTPLGMRDPALAAKLRRVAERARILSGAKGASIALKDEQGAFLCEASIGTALEVGLPLNLERGLSAECVTTQGLVQCNDAQNDPRIDAATREQLNLGSAVLLPLFAGNVLAGALGAFSNRPHAFGQVEIRRLHDLAQVIEAGVLREARGELKSMTAPEIPPWPGQGATKRKRDRGTRLATSVLRTFTATVLGCAMLFAGLMLYERYLATSVPPPSKLPARPEPSKTATTPANPGPSPQGSSEAVGAPAASETAPPVQAQPQVSGRAVPLEKSAREVKSLPKPAAVEPRTPPLATRSSETNRAAEVRQLAGAAAPELAAPQPAAAAGTGSSQVPAPSPTPQNEAQGRESAPPTVTPPATFTKPAPPSPPASHVDVLMTVLETKPKLAEANASPLPAPELTSRVEIPYPPAAVAQNKQGSVILRVTIGRKGTVDNIRVLDGDQVLTAEAVRAVSQWRYKPYRLAGREVGADLLVTVNFVLSP